MQQSSAASAKSVDVQEFINASPFSGFQWLVFGLCFFIALLDGFDTAAIGYIAPSLVAEWGVTKPALGPVLSAALFGLACGALSSGPLADAFGRKRVLTVAVAIFGIGTIVSAFAGGLNELTVYRFLTGIGLGAAMPNAATLLSEYCPDRRRATLVNAMFCGFPLGATCGGFLTAWMIPHWGWRSVLLLGGIVPTVLVVLLVFLLPESVRYMVAKAQPAEQIRAVMAKISAAAAGIARFTMTERAPAMQARSGLGVVLSKHYVVGSVAMWLACFMGLVIFYAIMNWMPILFGEAGMEKGQAILITSLFPLGGIGAVFFGMLMDRFNANRIIAVGYLLTALSIYAIGQVTGSIGLLVVTVFVAGTIMNTAHSSLPALAAAFYPTQGRTTGVSWMLGIGRFGGIAGSFLVAELVRRQLDFGEIFTVIAAAALVSMAALLVKQWVHPEEERDESEQELKEAVAH